ncbi:SMP-30/gluconolactonase/LRE family protein [Niabella terrae]
MQGYDYIHNMKIYRITVGTCLLAGLLALQAVGQPEAPAFFDSLGIVSGHSAALTRIQHTFHFTEGPVADGQGRVYFTDQPDNKIWRYDPATTILWNFKSAAGRANGLAIDTLGNIIACADENNEIWSIDSRGLTVKVLLGKVEGKRLNGPNDLWIDRQGGIYFTDPFYRRDYWKHQMPEQNQQRVYYLPPGASSPMVVCDDLTTPNGIIGTADGRYLFVADLGDQKTYRYRILPDGRLTDKTLFVAQGSDGLALDEKGHLYLSGKGVTVLDSMGHRIAFIPVPEKWVGNLCFAGKKRDLLFITAGPSVYTLKMNVKGN